MKRREFIFGSVAAAWPVGAWAQQGERVRRLGMLIGYDSSDGLAQARLAALRQELQARGWNVGQNLLVDYRWDAGNQELIRKYATELVALAPDVLVTAGGSHVGALQQATRTIPIVFANVTDPVGSGFVASMARPGGNVTGFLAFEYSMCGKWLEVLKQIAPHVTRTGVIRNPASAGGIGQLAAIQAVASSLGVEVSPIDSRDKIELERAIVAFARKGYGGLIVTANTTSGVHRELIVTLADRHRLPAVYSSRQFVKDGGLVAYGPDFADQYRRAAGYVDRILKGEKPADLPVQAPTKYELVINLKTAKTLDLNVPQSLLASANEVIE
jgi:putative ABC transport system substrate-binding protein